MGQHGGYLGWEHLGILLKVGILVTVLLLGKCDFLFRAVPVQMLVQVLVVLVIIVSRNVLHLHLIYFIMMMGMCHEPGV